MTHRVRHLSFGRNVPGKTDPMDGVEGVAEKVRIDFKYIVLKKRRLKKKVILINAIETILK